MSNPIDISAQINGLIPYEKYNYVFNGIVSNWPTVISPISGSFLAVTTSAKVDAAVYFCLSKTGCLDCEGLLPYDDCVDNIGDDFFSKIQLSFYSVNEPDNIYKSDSIKVKCSGCFPKIEFSSPNISIKKETEQIIQIMLSDLSPNQLYNYSIQTIGSDWPFSLSSTTGQIYPRTKTETITLYGGFCASTGSCPNGKIGVLPYTIQNDASPKNWDKAETSFRLLLTGPDSSSAVYSSNIIKLRCLDCTGAGGHIGVGVTVTEGVNC